MTPMTAKTAPVRKKAARPAPGVFRRLTVGSLTALIMLLAVEGAVRIVKTVGDDVRSRHQHWYRISPDLGWTCCPNFKGKAFEARREFDAQGYLTADTPKLRDGRPKVVVIGDSNAFGYKLETPDTYCAQLGAQLPEASVINLGVVGYTSYQGLRQVETRALQLNPAALIVSFNYNDRRYVVTPDQADGADCFHRLERATRIHQFNRDLYLLRLLSALAGQESIFDHTDEDWTLDDYLSKETHIRVETMPVRVGPEPYRDNLTRIARLAASRGIPVIFLLLRDNPSMTQFLQENDRLQQAGKTAEALELLKKNSDKNNFLSLEARRILARLYRAQGRPEEAERIGTINYPAYSQMGGTPLERDIDYNRIMREVAQATGQVVVDAGALTTQKPELYLDICHLNTAGHKLVTGLLRDPVRQALQRKLPKR